MRILGFEITMIKKSDKEALSKYKSIVICTARCLTHMANHTNYKIQYNQQELDKCVEELRKYISILYGQTLKLESLEHCYRNNKFSHVFTAMNFSEYYESIYKQVIYIQYAYKNFLIAMNKNCQNDKGESEIGVETSDPPFEESCFIFNEILNDSLKLINIYVESLLLNINQDMIDISNGTDLIKEFYNNKNMFRKHKIPKTDYIVNITYQDSKDHSYIHKFKKENKKK